MYKTLLDQLLKKPQKKTLPSDLQEVFLQFFPKPTFPVIHIAGTNGKGSVAEKIFAAYVATGKKVGLFTSPHITTYRERIRIGKNMISSEAFSSILQKIQEIQKSTSIELSFFTHLVFAAYSYFVEEKIDLAVIETGLGGRFDPTNMFDPILSIITQIGYDHMEVLGGDLDSIAYEKAGIIKKNTPVVLGPFARLPPIFAEAKAKNAPIILSKSSSFASYMEENNGTAQAALAYLGIDAGPAKKARPSCRFEILYDQVVLDVAHNDSGFSGLFQSLEKTFPEAFFRFVVALSKNKVLRTPFPKKSHVCFASFCHPKLATLEEMRPLQPLASRSTFSSDFSASLFEEAVKAQKENAILVVAGSFYIMTKAKKQLSTLFGQPEKAGGIFSVDPAMK